MLSNRSSFILSLTLSAGLFFSSTTNANSFTAIDLGVGQAYGINNSGQVVGVSAGGIFLTGANGVGTTSLGISAYHIGGINDSGQIAGTYWNSSSTYHGFVTGPNGVGVTDIGTLGGLWSEGYGINNVGQVTGYSYTSSNATHAFITGPNGVGMTDLGTLDSVNASLGGGINDSGQVAGWGGGYAFVTGPNGAGMMYLGNLGGLAGTIGGNSWGQAINSTGQVVGFSETGTFTSGLPDYHAFITGPNGVGMMDLGTLGGPRSEALDINDFGQVVGWSQIAGNSPVSGGSPFVTGVNGSAMTNLNSLVVLSGGAYLTSVIGINNLGQIAANGSDGHAYLLAAAVPEPAIYSLLMAGLGLIGFIARRKHQKQHRHVLPSNV